MTVAGIVCEGQSDFAILSEVLCRLWPETEQVLLLQPILDSLDRAQGASGASGVNAWCMEHRGKLASVIDSGAGPRLDLLVIALDADAAIDAGIDDPPKHPSAYDATRLCSKLRTWLGGLPPELLIVIPAMAIEAWVVAARYPRPANPETILRPAHYLVDQGVLFLDTRPKRQHKVIKPPEKYRGFGRDVASRWPRVAKRCREASRFERKLQRIKQRAGA
ncbi:MAG: hypothetical protein E6J90_48325 [Deltaproteobacteria bacterium]|nr:MAG: hypothetical protein E6J90_48325 [Deltaproteobacteria bacterium]